MLRGDKVSEIYPGRAGSRAALDAISKRHGLWKARAGPVSALLALLAAALAIPASASAAEGDLDTSFSGDGKATTDIGTGDRGYALAIDSQGRIVLGGHYSNGSNDDFALARYNPNGSLDSSFSGDGKVTTQIGSSHDDGYALAIDAQDRIVLGGRSSSATGFDFALARYIGDATPPQTTITSGPTGTIATSNATFAFTSSEAGSTFQCRLDSAAWSGCSSPKTYSGLADGAHSFYVRATDQAGNADPTPASRSFTVDTAVAGAKASARRVQRQHRRVKVKVKATAKEGVIVKATGKVKVGGKKLKLKRRRKAIDPGERVRLALRPKRRRAGAKVMRALAHHKRVKALVRVRFTDRPGNSTTKKLAVRLK